MSRIVNGRALGGRVQQARREPQQNRRDAREKTLLAPNVKREIKGVLNIANVHLRLSLWH